MTRAWMLALVLAAACGCTRPCRPGTAFVSLHLVGASVAATSLVVSLSVDGAATQHSRVPHHPGAADDSFEVQFEHYRAGAMLTVTVSASDGMGGMASGTTTRALDATCTTLDVTVSGGGGGDRDLAVTPAGDFAVTPMLDLTMPHDLRMLDLGSAPAFQPSHISGGYDPNAADLTNPTLIDTGSLQIGFGGVPASPPTGITFRTISGYAVLSCGQFIVNIPELKVRGSLPLIIVAAKAVSIGSPINAKGNGEAPGPGGSAPGSGPGAGQNGGTRNTSQNGGGGGAGFGTAGAPGADSNGAPATPVVLGAAGGAYGSAATFSGGSGGGSGGSAGSCGGGMPTTNGSGGAGGGAIQISTPAGITITAMGSINVGGGRGAGGCALAGNNVGGGGGGSGGEIFLEALGVLNVNGILIANGGGGGGSALAAAAGQQGEDGHAGDVACASGGNGGNLATATIGNGGNGGCSATAPTAGVTDTGGGGGGGAVGQIWLRGSPVSVGAMVSPAYRTP